MFNITNRIVQLLEKKISTRFKEINESNLLAIGSLLSKQQFSMSSSNINDYEFKIFSEYGDDGIILMMTTTHDAIILIAHVES
jgi:hypothetical protein